MTSSLYGRNILFAAALLLPAMALNAQMPGGSGSSAPLPQTSVPQPQAPAPPTSNPPPYAGLPQGRSELALMNQTFVRNAMENDQDQIALSKLAAQKSSSADVKQFAAETVVVRGRLTGQLESLAKQLKVSKPTKPSKKTRKQIEKLQALSGPSFDSAYLEEIGKLQRKDLDQFRTEVRNSPNAGLRKGIWQDMQILAGRYRTLEKIAKAHNVDLGGKK